MHYRLHWFDQLINFAEIIKIDMKNEVEKLSYCLGVNIGLSLKPQGVDKIDAQLLANAINDVVNGSKLQVDMEEVKEVLNNHFSKLQAKMNEKVLKAQEEFFTANSKNEGVITLDSGLQYQIMKEGDGEKPTLTSEVTTHYHGTTIDGNVFDSSVDRGTPATFPINGVIAGWTEALQMMTVGSKWKLFVPSALAYGERGAGTSIGPHTPLIFEVELLEIN